MKVDGTRTARTALPTRPSQARASDSRPSTQDVVHQGDFPPFVAELIGGVFDAVVDQSIEQMKAYGELLKGTAQSVDSFRAAQDPTPRLKDDDD